MLGAAQRARLFQTLAEPGAVAGRDAHAAVDAPGHGGGASEERPEVVLVVLVVRDLRGQVLGG